MSEESFDKVIDVNLKGTFLINQLSASAMKEADIKGSIVNISSITGKTGKSSWKWILWLLSDGSVTQNLGFEFLKFGWENGFLKQVEQGFSLHFLPKLWHIFWIVVQPAPTLKIHQKCKKFGQKCRKS